VSGVFGLRLTAERARQAAVYTIPSAACLAVFWPGIRAWFQADDFAWLGLRLHVAGLESLLRALFQPMAQGTIRPWSERLFFLAFQQLFGVDALPFRIWVFFTQTVSLVLAAAVAKRLTGSSLAALLAGLFWGVNASLGLPLSWTSSYNQILCATFLLAAFYCFLRYTELGKRRWLAASWTAYLLGFGALELNVVFPVLAAGYAVLSARRFLRAIAPMFLVSGLYAMMHRLAAPKIESGHYKMHLDASILGTLATYWQRAFGGFGLRYLDVAPWLQRLGEAAPWMLSAGLLVFLVIAVWKGRMLGLFPLLWFLALLAPVLPLRDHVSDYYLATPTIGLAMLGGWAFAAAWVRGWLLREAAILLSALYLVTSIPAGRAVAEYNRQRSQAVKRMVLGVVRARQLHPDKVILLNSVGTDLFWAGIHDKPFRIFHVSDVFLTPGSENNIPAQPELGDVTEYVLPPAQTLAALEGGAAVVYSAAAIEQGGRLANITKLYAALAKSQLRPEVSRRLDAGHPAFAGQLGEGWYAAENGYRWMGRRAVLWLGGPRSQEEMLRISGFCPAVQLKQGPLELAVSIQGGTAFTVQLNQADREFRLAFPLPAELVGKERVEVRLEVSRAFAAPGDGRQLGLVFGSFAIR